MQKFLEKNYRIIVGLILGFMAIVSVLNAWNDSAIFDETAHIPASYSYVTQHEIRLNPEHPPLLKDLAGLSIFLAVHPHFDVNGQAFWNGTLPGKWDEGQWAAGRYLLYQAGNNADKIIFWARFPIVILSLIFGWFIFRWVKELAGTTAGLFALTFYAFDPNILGHNHFVTTDLGIAAFTTFAFYYYLKFIKFPTWKNVLLAGIFTGLMMLVKFSFITALPIFLASTVVYSMVIRPRTEEKEKFFRLKKFGEYFGKGALVFILSLLTVWAVYALNTFKMTQETVNRSIENNFPSSDTTNIKAVYTNKTLHLLNNNQLIRPLTEFGIGIGYVFRRVSGGNGAYFIEKVSGNAFRAYFPTVFAIKEPLPSLALMTLALLISIAGTIKTWSKNFKRSYLSVYIRENITELSLFGFIVLYAYISITGNLNIGFRHLFPILPFIYILTAKSIFSFMRKLNNHGKTILGTIVALFSVFLIAGTASAYPSYMSYFNELAGGPKNGYNYVTDSNADWGQDLKRLKIWVDQYNFCASGNITNTSPSFCQTLSSPAPVINQPVEKIHINYFGGGDIKYYFGNMAIDWWDSKRPIEPGWYAVSANSLQGSIYDTTKKDNETYRWLKTIPPITQVGTSIFIYHISPEQAQAAK